MALIQAIVYSKATGRVRRVHDPQAVVANAIQFLNQIPLAAGEKAILYTKVGGGADTIFAWQAAANTASGLSVTPGVDAGDTYAEVDALNNILAVHFADPACGDGAPNGGTLVKAPAGCNPRWTYSPPSTFTPPAAHSAGGRAVAAAHIP